MSQDSGLVCKHYPRLDSVPSEDLARLFPAVSDTPYMIPLVQRSGFEGFNLRSIVVFKEERPVLFLPLFEARFNLSTFLDEGWFKKILKIASHLLPPLFNPRVLGIGFIEGEWSEIGIDAHMDGEALDDAWDLALKALETLADELKSDLVAFNNFNPMSGKVLPMGKLKAYTQVPSLPCALLPVPYQGLKDYINHLSRNARKNLHRKMREANDVRIIRTRNPRPFLDKIYHFYQKTAEQSEITFGVHRRLYFKKICDVVPGAEYVLYFVREKLIAFNLLIVKPEVLVDKYFGMDFFWGRKHNLYFVSWLENVRYCIENKIPLYHAGQAAEKTKAHLGAYFIPSAIIFKHRRPVIHRLLAMMKKYLSYHSPVNVPQARLGKAWRPELDPAFSKKSTNVK